MGRLKNDGGTDNACGAHQEGAQARNDTIRHIQVGSTLSATIEDQQLMPDQYGFGDEGTDPTRFLLIAPGDDHMNDEDEEVAHPAIVSAPETGAIQPN